MMLPLRAAKSAVAGILQQVPGNAAQTKTKGRHGFARCPHNSGLGGSVLLPLASQFNHLSFTMPRSRSRAASLGGSSDETESAFYEALQRGDIELLMSCWAEEDDIVCVHPGGPRLLGAGAIRAAFEGMFANGTVRARPVQVHRVVALSSAVHSVAEEVEVMLPDGLHQAVVLATNVYHKTPEGWRMVAHHASAGTAPDAQAVGTQRPVLH